jgi:hypothetical protein
MHSRRYQIDFYRYGGNYMKKALLLLMLSTVLLFFSSTSQASNIVVDFGIESAGGICMQGTSAYNGYYFYDSFTFTEDMVVTGVNTYSSYFRNNEQFRVEIYQDNNNLPGNLLFHYEQPYDTIS